MSAAPRRVVVYFDGTCNLCNAFVDFLIRRDRRHRILYASRQGASFAALAGRHPELAETDTMLTWIEEGGEGRAFLKSDATLAALGELPAPWPSLRGLRVVPLGLRNAVYDWVARNRYRFFGRRATCRLPSPEERALFLD